MLIFEGHDKALGVMCIDIEPCTTDDRTDFFIPTNSDRLGNTWRPGKILLNTDELSSKSDILIGAQLADDLFTPKSLDAWSMNGSRIQASASTSVISRLDERV